MHAAKVSRSTVMKVGAVDVENEETIEEVSIYCWFDRGSTCSDRLREDTTTARLLMR